MAAKGKVKVFIPKTRKDEPDAYVCINGKGTLIKRGIEVEVSQEVAEVLKHSQRSDAIAMEYIEKMEAAAAEKEGLK